MRSPYMKIILLLVIYCLSCHVQPATGRRIRNRTRTKTKMKCTGGFIQICSHSKRGDIGDLAQATNLGADEERPGTQEARGGEGREVGRENGGFRGAREGDDLRPESSDRKQLSEERELDDIGKRHHSPLDSELGRLRSLLKKTVLDVEDREEEEEQEEEPERSIIIDTNRSYVVNDTWGMVVKILAAIESELILQPANSDSEGGKRSYEEEADDN